MLRLIEPIKEKEVDALYQRPKSITDWLPWTDYEDDTQTFTLEDGYSAAIMFEITGVSTEARSEQFFKRSTSQYSNLH